MFPAEDGKTWEPYKIRPIKKAVVPSGGDVEMGGTDGEGKKDDEDEQEFEEDLESDEGAVYPLTGLSSASVLMGLLLTRRRGAHHEYASFLSSFKPCTQHTQPNTPYSNSPDSSTSLDRPRPRVSNSIFLREVQDARLLYNG
jgi:hypothetical protein